MLWAPLSLHWKYENPIVGALVVPHCTEGSTLKDAEMKEARLGENQYIFKKAGTKIQIYVSLLS